MKKILKITGIVLLSLIVIAFIIPFAFRSKITSMIKTQINQRINARVDFSDVDLSLFRNFPRLAVALDSLRVIGKDEFAGDTLASVRRINVALDLFSVFGDEMKIHSITVDQPRIHAIVHKNGNANWKITLPEPSSAGNAATTPAKPFKMALQQYAIMDGYISYKDELGNMSAEIGGLNHSGKGDFNSDLFTLETSTNAAALTFIYGGIPYLVQTKANVDANFEVDNKTAKYTFKVDDMAVNDLRVHTEGFFQLLNDSSYGMDIKFNGPSLDFKSILSLVPSIYKKDFAAVKTSGQASLDGFVRGKYDAHHIPAYHVDLEVKDGTFQYPDLPRPVKNIQVSFKADNPDGVTDHTVVEIHRAHFEMDDAPFDCRLLMKTPVSDMYIDAEAKGKLDLAKVAQFVKLEAGTKLAGLLDADINMKGYMSFVEKKEYDRFNAGGSLALTGFSYSSPAYPTPVIVNDLSLTFNPKNVTLNTLKGSYGQTHFNASGSIDDLLGYMMKNRPLDGSFTVKADQVNLDELMGTTPGGGNAGTGSAGPSADKTAAAAPMNVFLVPSNIKFTLHAGIDKLLYGMLELRNMTGEVTIADETVKLENVKAEGLEGTMAINGGYSTKVSKKNPAIAFAYDVQHLDVQKTFYAFNTVQKIMPAGKYIAGKFSSKMTMSGVLGADMKPDLNTLSGEGNLLLADGALKDFAPTDKLSQTLKLDELKDLPLKDLKANFSFKNGRVVVDPFHIRVKDIDMEVGGSHGFDQTLDYTLNMNMPRALLGGQANSVADNAIAKAGQKGMAFKLSDRIALPVKVEGTVTNPVLRADVKGALSSTAGSLAQQAKDLVKNKVDSAKQQLKDTAREVGKQALKDAGTQLKNQLLGGGAKDSTAQAGTGLDNTKKKAAEAGKGMLNSLFGKKKAN